MFIAGNEPDLMLISEILPKNRLVFVNASSLIISGYALYLNFDSNIDPSSTLGICGVGIFVSKKISAAQVHFGTPSFKDHVWVSINLQGHDKLLIGCIYHSPSTNMDASILSLCSLLGCLQDFTHLLICGDFIMREVSWSNMQEYPRNCHIEFFLNKFMICSFFNMLLSLLVLEYVLLLVYSIWYLAVNHIW